MKKVIISCVILLAITGCDYTEQERSQFRANCVSEYHSKNVLYNIASECACRNWAKRKDIKPKNEKKKNIQYDEEEKKCYSTPIKDDYKMRQSFVEYCKKTFFEVYPSSADLWAASSLYNYEALDAIAFVGSVSPEIYKRPTNRDLVDCACSRLSTRDDFTLPRSMETLKKEFAKESKTCQKDNKRNKK